MEKWRLELRGLKDQIRAAEARENKLEVIEKGSEHSEGSEHAERSMVNVNKVENLSSSEDAANEREDSTNTEVLERRNGSPAGKVAEHLVAGRDLRASRIPIRAAPAGIPATHTGPLT